MKTTSLLDADRLGKSCQVVNFLSRAHFILGDFLFFFFGVTICQLITCEVAPSRRENSQPLWRSNNFQIGNSKSRVTFVFTGTSMAVATSQWIFSVPALSVTPSIMTSGYTLDKELYDRARGVEFLFRLGSSLGLSAFPLTCLLTSLILSLRRPSTAMFTAATWFHRFFMRYSLEDYHRQVRCSR